MNHAEPLGRTAADTYAAWFNALANGTRVQIVSLLARSGEPMTVRQIVAAVRLASPPYPRTSSSWLRSGS